MKIFPRPRTDRPRPASALASPPRSGKAYDSNTPKAELPGTVAAVIGIFFTGLFLQGRLPSDVARFAAIGTAISLAVTLGTDLRRGFQNLIRADVMALLAFYFLTFFEFLFPQSNFDDMIVVSSTSKATLAVLVGFAGLLIGRHLIRPKEQPFRVALTSDIPAAWLTSVFWFCMAVGYAHMLIAVNFNVIEMIDFVMAPRFSQPWARGRFGDWKALLVELGLFLYLLPPLAGIILARRHRYYRAQVFLVMLAFFFTLFCAFASGTRNVFATYLVTFLIGYAFAVPPGRRKQLITMSAICAGLMFAATISMLQFRGMGLKNYLTGARGPVQSAEQSLFVDYNLYAMGKLTEVFPERWPYLGWEIPYQALIRPIPRAMWKGKPEGLSASIEDALGVEGLTIAASFAGEAYMSGGYVAVLIAGLFFGAVSGWWGFLSSPRNSELGILIYASGFFAAVISMRSLLVFTTALLPTAAAIIICVYLARLVATQARRVLTRTFTPRRPLPQPRSVPQKRA